MSTTLPFDRFDEEGPMTAVVAVTARARGFVMELANPFNQERHRVVITAAHCLPELPPAHRGSYQHKRTYALLGPLTDKEPTIMAECRYVDPVADIAVLGEPDGQAAPAECEAYRSFIEKTGVLRLSSQRPAGEIRGYLLSTRLRVGACVSLYRQETRCTSKEPSEEWRAACRVRPSYWMMPRCSGSCHIQVGTPVRFIVTVAPNPCSLGVCQYGLSIRL
jgi:hypothetical protein